MISTRPARCTSGSDTWRGHASGSASDTWTRIRACRPADAPRPGDTWTRARAVPRCRP
ncbi:MAG TPA: hypothetical protein VGG75_26335 [Trebonia sp.]|jgi:hypothetical protein